MSYQISGQISCYMTNSKPQDTTQTKTQSYGLLRQRDQATVLDFSPERGDGSGSDERGDVVQPSTRRDAATTDVTAGGPTLRRTAALQTHATQHGRQRRRTRLCPTDSLQLSRLTHDLTRSTTSADSFPPDGLASALPADPRPDMVDNVGGLVSARRTHFSSSG